MPDNIRSFRAASVADALAQIRREMGHEAVVVETKQLAQRGLFSWFAAQAEVQVTASVAKTSRRSSNSQRSAGSLPLVMQPTTQGTVAAAAAQARRSGTTTTLPPLAQASPERSCPVVEQLEIDRLSSFHRRGNVPRVTEPNELEGRSTRGALPTRLNDRVGLAQVVQPHVQIDTQVREVKPEAVPPNDIEQRLDALHKMIAELGRQTRPRGLVEIPPGLFAHYLALIEGDVEDEIARELIAKLQQHATPEQLDNTASMTALLTALVEREIRCTEPLLPKRGYRRVAMLVGPTGVGKTTTIAKLAGRFGLEGDLRVGLITVDTYRVAAVEQLRTYAEIIDLPLQVVSSPDEFPAALEQFAEFDLVLIDTAGRSPHDDRQLEELKQLVAAASPDDICLVLSLASGAKSLRTTADRFAAVRPTSLILTKLDEAAGCGGLLSVSRDIAIPISYFTLGQEVPRDIEPANACRAARLVLGRDRLGHQPAA